MSENKKIGTELSDEELINIVGGTRKHPHHCHGPKKPPVEKPVEDPIDIMPLYGIIPNPETPLLKYGVILNTKE